MSQATGIESIASSFMPLATLTLGNHPNLTDLEFAQTNVPTVDVSNCPNLESFIAYSGALTTLDLSNLEQLTTVNVTFNAITELDISNTTNLNIFQISDNLITTFNAEESPNLSLLSLENNLIETIFVTNGNYEQVNFGGNNDLSFICCDPDQVTELSQLAATLGYTTTVVAGCTEANYQGTNIVEGSVHYDFNNTGCNPSLPVVPFVSFEVDNGTEMETIIGSANGTYSIGVADGQYTITPQLETPEYFAISPTSFTVDFPTDPTPFLQNLCVVPDGDHPDVEITIVPTTPARPGFEATYNLMYTNKGNQVRSGDITLTYVDTLMQFVEATPVFDSELLDTYTWNYTDLNPFETRVITITFLINEPTATPPVNIDDILTFTANITPVVDDEFPDDNVFVLDQTVVGSFDPNDITCLQGETIAPEEVGAFVHYLIRFENTGTFAAENVRVEDAIDIEKFDMTSLRPVQGSHTFTTEISGNEVVFRFDGINLPFNDEDNDGFVLFKIKTAPGLELGDSFSNEAEIYFDFNAPIITNTYTTTVEVPLGVENHLPEEGIVIYPNPAENILHIFKKETVEIISVEINNILGQAVFSNSGEVSAVDVSSFNAGTYFIKIHTSEGVEISNFIKK